jgi:hypothetical protein
MNVPRIARALPSLTAISLLSFGVFQACTTTRGPGVVRGTCSDQLTLCWKTKTEVRPKDADGREVPREKVTRGHIARVIAKFDGRPRNFTVCEWRGPRKSECKPVYESLIRKLKGTRTTQVDESQLESGGGDDSESTEGIHVVQQIDFKSEEQKKEFVAELGLESDSGTD